MSIDKNIKQSLENYEMPYDSKAWDFLSEKLDAKMPINTKATHLFTKNWMIAASVLTITSIATVVYLASNNETLSVKSNNSEQIISKAENVNTKEKQNITVSNITTKEKELSNQHLNQKNVSESSSIGKSNSSETRLIKENSTNESNSPKDNSIDAQNVKNKSNKIVIPAVSDVCLGSKINIENNNNEIIYLIQPNNKSISIESNKVYNQVSNLEGMYEIGYYINEKFIVGNTFNVKANPSSDFVFDTENAYNKEGLPTVIFKATNQAVDYEWTVDKKELKSENKEVEAHFYKKGDYKVTLVSKQGNGCKSSESKNFKFTNNNILLAVSGFVPSSSNTSDNTFIPYMLTKRDVKFVLTIYDINGKEVYKTNDSNQPWNGVDPSTNEISKPNSIFIWKVVLENPQEGEGNQYSGTVTIM